MGIEASRQSIPTRTRSTRDGYEIPRFPRRRGVGIPIRAATKKGARGQVQEFKIDVRHQWPTSPILALLTLDCSVYVFLQFDLPIAIVID